MLKGIGGQRKTIRVYDFRRPDKFSKEQIRSLHMIYDTFSRSLTTSLSAQLRVAVQVSVRDVQQLTFAEFLERLDDPTTIALVSLPPLDGSAVMELDTRLTFAIIDRIFGGSGHSPEKPRALTDIEETVIKRVLKAMLGSFQEAWSSIIHLEPELRSIESKPMFAQIVSPGEMCANTVFELDLGPLSGRLQVCVPHIVLEPVIPKLSTHRWFMSESRTGEGRGAGSRVDLNGVDVNVTVRLGTAWVKFGELAKLAPGQILPLNRRRDEEVELIVGDRPVFKAVPGRRGQRLAVRITGVIEDMDGGELR